MNTLKEYIVTLHKHEDLDEFYKDMETLRPTAYNCMPERTVDVIARRPLSRNTHYWLTAGEVAVLKNDPRVRSIELTPRELGIVVRPSWVQSSLYWDKSQYISSNQTNWGLLRVIEGKSRPGWGADGTSYNQSGKVAISEEGRNVDVVIVDGHIDPSHPEYAVNADGTGGSRVIQFDWNTLTPQVAALDNDGATDLLDSAYLYEPYISGNSVSENNHGAHVAGIAAGNTQGWARKANIYNLNPYGNNSNTFDVLVLFDYLRAFHNSKPINPETGRRNPTICNHSWGFGYQVDLADSPATSIEFRGSVIPGPFTVEQLQEYGIFVRNNIAYIPAAVDALNADVEDAIADGIIMVASASNDFTKIDLPGGQDYNNSCTFGDDGTAYYNRGSSPGNATGVICVGSIDTTAVERKAEYSNTGPRIDVWAPGSQIVSSVNIGSTPDPRNYSYYIKKDSGTSAACPQVCGVLACILETYPDFTQEQAKEYIISHAVSGQLTDSTSALNDYQGLHGAPNLVLAYYKERPTEGNVFPKLNYKFRPTSGAVYPRVRRR